MTEERRVLDPLAVSEINRAFVEEKGWKRMKEVGRAVKEGMAREHTRARRDADAGWLERSREDT